MKTLIVTSEKMMNVRAIAEAMGVSRKTVERCIARIFPDKMEHGKKTLLNEAEVACISKELKSNKFVMSHLSEELSQNVSKSETYAEIMANLVEAEKKALAFIQKENERLALEKEQLKIQLDESKEWYSIKRMEKLNPEMSFPWKLLKKKSEELGISPKKVFDENYGEVNTYHKDVWENIYYDTINY